MRDNTFSKKVFIKTVSDNLKNKYRKTIDDATQQELYQAVSEAVKDVIMDEWIATQRVMDKDDPKVVYYMSMEFLMGRALGNNLINLTAYKEVKEALDELGLDLNVIEDQEPDPALGNGGLGRLAACFLDSLATLNYSAYGCGIRYRYGMFKQQIKDGYQVEVPDNWLKDGYPFELRRPEYAKEVHFGGYVDVEYDPATGSNKFVHKGYQAVKAVPFDMPIVGYNNKIVNTLRIWDAEPIVDFELDSFDKGDYKKAVEQENLARNIVEVLYPNDNHMAGKELRLKQQYFFVSASLQAALEKYKKNHDDIHKLPEKMTIQMNDTHPTVAVAELMRLLLDEEGLGWDEAKPSGGGGLFGALFGSPSRQAIDCDASAIMLKNGKFTDKTDLVYFGNLKHKSGTVNHMGDNLTGAGEGDDEQIVIDLSRVPAEYDKIVIVVNIYQAVKRKQHFGMIQNAFIRLVDARNNKEMCKYNLTENYSGMTAMIFGEIYRYNGEWKFNAVGNGTTDPGLGELCQRFV